MARARWAERLVARWYQRRGYSILAMNWTVRGGELDVVARRSRTVVVCEVKARANNDYGSAAEAMTPRKQLRVRRAASEFLRQSGLGSCVVRFDLACVTGTRLEVFEDAF